MVLLLACAGGGDDSVPTELPPEETYTDTAPDSFLVDSSFTDTGGNTAPAHLLELRHEGSWSLSPEGGPWTAMTGAFTVTEVLDGDVENPACELEWSLTGEEADSGCEGCVASFVVHHYLASGDREACQDPDLPEDGEDRSMGWSDADGVIRYDVGDSGVWVDWYAGERLGDELSFLWEATVGVAVEDTGE